jgi:hypothetical protein
MVRRPIGQGDWQWSIETAAFGWRFRFPTQIVQSNKAGRPETGI